MGLLQIGRSILGVEKKAAKPKTPPAKKRHRRTYAQIEADRVKEIDAKIAALDAETRYNRALKRAKMQDGGEEDQSWTDVVKSVAPDLIKVFAGNIAQLTPKVPTADAPTQIPETATTQPGDDTMDAYSKAILPHVRGKSPEDAAAWLRATGKADPVMGKAVIGRLVATPEAKLPALLNDYEAFAPAFIQYCRINYEWFLRTVRCLKPPTNITPVDPVSAAL